MKTKKEYDLDDIVRAFAIGIAIMMVASKCQAQTVLPNAILDTMIMEVKYARQCRITVDTLQDETKKLEAELVANGTALNLSQRSNETLSALLRNSRESQEIQGLQFQKDLKEEKKKTGFWKKAFFILLAGVAVKEGVEAAIN